MTTRQHHRSTRHALLAGIATLATVALSTTTLAATGAGKTEVAQWTPATWHETMQAMPTGDAARGEKLHDEKFCASCHGSRGEALTGNWPLLAGQRAEYTYKQLLDYAEHRRAEDQRAHIMNVAAAELDRQEMADLAAFYEQQGLPEAARPGDAHPAHQLVSVGDPTRLITPCAACHGSNGSGGINESPTLRGQPEAYFMRTMALFRDGERGNDVAHGMSQFAQPLTDEEIANLAEYYATE